MGKAKIRSKEGLSCKCIRGDGEVFDLSEATRYAPDFALAVRFLYLRGIRRTGEIARRLEVSPYSVRNIIADLREAGLLDAPRQVLVVYKSVEEEEEKPRDVLEEILGV